MSKKVYVSCTIISSPFSGERQFEVATAMGGTFVGAAPVDYFRTLDLKAIAEGDVSERRTGWVAGRILERSGGKATISVPLDGVVTVDEGLVKARHESAALPAQT